MQVGIQQQSYERFQFSVLFARAQRFEVLLGKPDFAVDALDEEELNEKEQGDVLEAVIDQDLTLVDAPSLLAGRASALVQGRFVAVGAGAVGSVSGCSFDRQVRRLPVAGHHHDQRLCRCDSIQALSCCRVDRMNGRSPRAASETRRSIARGSLIHHSWREGVE